MTSEPTTPDLAVVVSPRGWAQDLHRFVADHGGARVRHRVLDAREAAGATYDVLVIDDLTSFVSARLVANVQRDRRRVLGLYDPAEPTGRRRLEDLGVDEVAPVTAAPEELIAIAQALAAGLRLHDGLEQLADEPTAGDLDHRAPVVAIGGPSGGTGATEIALSLAVACAARGEAVVLIDGDEFAPSLAQRLNLDLHPNLRVAVEAARSTTDLDAAMFTIPVPAGSLRVVGGLPTPASWADVRPAEVIDLIHDLALEADRVIVNVGHGVEQHAVGGDRGRFDQTREILTHVDGVLVVGAPTPIGVARLLDWVATVRQLTRAPIDVVVNRAPSSSFVQGEIRDEIRRSWSPMTLEFLPEERDVATAVWAGTIVTGRRWRKLTERLAERVLSGDRIAATARAQAPRFDPLGAGL